MKRYVFLVTLSLAAISSVLWGLLSWRANSAESEWAEFVTRWEARGEKFDVESHLPRSLPAERNFAAHPWLLRIAANDNELLARLERSNPYTVEGFDEWDEDCDEDGVHNPMSPELAKRLLDLVRDLHGDISQFSEAAAREGCRIEPNIGGNHLIPASWPAKLKSMSDLLAATSQAEATLGNWDSVFPILDTMFRAGAHLRSTNLGLPFVTGIGFEADAMDMLESVLKSGTLPRDQFARFQGLLERNCRTPEEDFAALSRAERGRSLRIIDVIDQSPEMREMLSIPSLGWMKRRFLARLRMETCSTLQEMVLTENGSLVSVPTPVRLTNYIDVMEKNKETEGSAGILARLGLDPMISIYQGTCRHAERHQKLNLALSADNP